MEKTISEMTHDEFTSMIRQIKEEFIEKKIIKKPKYVRKKGPRK